MMTIERPLVFSALQRELARDLDDLVARHAGDLLGPGRRVGHVVVVGLGDVARRRSRGRRRSWRGTGRRPRRPAPRRRRAATRLRRHVAHQHARRDRCRRSGRARDCRNRGRRRRRCSSLDRRRSDSRSLVVAALGLLLLEVPLALLAPAEADRAVRHDDAARRSRRRRPSSIRDCWPRPDRRRSREARSEPFRHQCVALGFTRRTSIGMSVYCADVVVEVLAPAGRRGTRAGSRGPSPWPAPRRCPASPSIHRSANFEASE